MQFSVIGACVIALVAMVRSSGDAGPVAGTATVDFNDVIQLLARSPAAPSQRPGVVAPDPVRLARRMRAAEAAFRRQDKTRARDHYARLRRYIAGTGSDDEVDRQLLLLVEERLAAIANMPGS